MTENSPTLSIVTPTYNRGSLLMRCFTSLKEQTSHDFEWIIIDDGSTDDTESVAAHFLDEKTDFPIYYEKKENGGKHTALNASHKYIHGEYVLILDSDDRLTLDAVASALQGWSGYEEEKDIGIVTFLKENSAGEVYAYAADENIPTDVLRYKRVCRGSSDCCEVIRASLFQKYPFPVFEGERFLAETALWYRAGLEGSCVYINKPIYICEYLEGGLTASGRKMRVRNPQGGMYTSNLRMHRRCRLPDRIKAGLLFVCYGFFAHLHPRDILQKYPDHRALKTVCLLPGYLMYCVWRNRYL